MKNLFVILFMLGCFQIIKAQNFVYEDFSSGQFPPEGWTVDAQIANWNLTATQYAGGTPPEAHLYYNPTFNGTSRLISPAIDLTGFSVVTLQFNHFMDYYSSGTQIGVATRVGAGGAWHNVWTQTVSGNIGPEVKYVEINNSDVNQPDFQFCIFFSGNSYNIDNWFIDNIKLFAPPAVDACLAAVLVEDIVVSGNTQIKARVDNVGSTAITAITLNWQIDGGDIVTNSLNVTIPKYTSYNYLSNTTWNATAGLHQLKIWISAVNGSEGDNNNTNNELIKDISVASKNIQRVPCFEEFTSSTCGPCASLNGTVLNPFFNAAQGITYVKYQMNWPGSGDIYYTAEGGVRRQYYGVSYVPDLYGDGKRVESTSSVSAMNNFLVTMKNDPGFISVHACHIIDQQTHEVQVSATFVPYFTGTGFTAFVVVFENVTTGNVGSNGETQFKHVMMKMLPDANGTPLSFTDGVPVTLNLNGSLNGTHVEQYSDLNIVVFVQQNSTKKIFNSRYSNVKTEVAFNYTNATEVPVQPELVLTFSEPVRKTDNAEIDNTDISDFVTLWSTSGQPLSYTASISIDKMVMTIVPAEPLAYEQEYFISVDGVENNLDIPVDSVAFSFTTMPEPTAPVGVFNIENDADSIGIDTHIILTFDQPVRMPDNTPVDGTNVHTFITFVSGDNAVDYTASVNSVKTVIDIVPVSSLQFNTSYSLSVEGLESNFDIAMVPASLTFTTIPSAIAGLSAANLKIYPVPVSGTLFIETNGHQAATDFELVNQLGEVIGRYNTENGRCSIDVHNFKAGLYYLVVRSGNQLTSRKIQIVK